MVKPLMPKATAVWLIENTALTFEQIGAFCGLHTLEVQGIADGDVAKGIIGLDPRSSGQLTREEIERCEKNSNSTLQISEMSLKLMQQQKLKSTTKYTPVARRKDKPDGVAWLLKNCPELSSTQIAKLLGSTKNTVELIKSKTHYDIGNIKPKDPVLLSLCSQTELNRIYAIAKKKAELAQIKQEEE